MSILPFSDLPMFLDGVSLEGKIDLSNFKFIDPVYWAIFKAEMIRKRHLGKKMQIVIDPKSPAYSYLKYILGKFESSTTVPIRVVENRAHIEKFTNELVGIMKLVTLDFDEEDQEFFKYIIGELLTNAIDHGASPAVVCAQRFPNLNEVEIAVVDIGNGFFHTISRRYKVSSPAEAILKAIEKGVSGAIDYLYGGAQRNAGMGLYVISRLVKDAGGTMYIISDDVAIQYPYSEGEPKAYKLSNEWKGSIVAIRFKLDSFQKNVIDFGFYTYMNMIIEEDIKEDIF